MPLWRLYQAGCAPIFTGRTAQRPCTAPLVGSACGDTSPRPARPQRRQALVARLPGRLPGFPGICLGHHAAHLPAAPAEVWGQPGARHFERQPDALSRRGERRVFTLNSPWRGIFSAALAALGLFQSLGLDGQPPRPWWCRSPAAARANARPEVLPPAARQLSAATPRATPNARPAAGARGSACDHACPMRLNPRNIKRMMFACVVRPVPGRLRRHPDRPGTPPHWNGKWAWTQCAKPCGKTREIH